ncbi:hypothetical protein BKA63DRAFT_495659 [Paraphoma chrysanthemicola]|nr:hypothetical protein BKA63DRAFT_495659 [Paraphoma chrysanthemicola]
MNRPTSHNSRNDTIENATPMTGWQAGRGSQTPLQPNSHISPEAPLGDSLSVSRGYGRGGSRGNGRRGGRGGSSGTSQSSYGFRQHWSFFYPGMVFTTRWVEILGRGYQQSAADSRPGAGGSTASNRSSQLAALNVFEETAFFVVIYCNPQLKTLDCLRINTYNYRGLEASSVNPQQRSLHAVVHSRGQAPDDADNNYTQQPTVSVCNGEGIFDLHLKSRVCLYRLHSLDIRLPVLRHIGEVDDFNSLLQTVKRLNPRS